MTQTAQNTQASHSSDTASEHDHILILDFGSQVTQLIARRVRESGVYCEIWPFNDVDEARIKAYNPKGIILSGGPCSVTEKDSPRAPDCVFTMGVPLLGICYGQQTMVEQLGGNVTPGNGTGEFGRAHVDVTGHNALLDGVWDKGAHEQVWMSHGDHVSSLPDGFEVVGTSEGAPYAVIADESRNFYGVQFHPEVVHTPHGSALFKNFTHGVCGCKGDWTMAAFKEESIAKIREQVGDAKVICGLSGGVDSSVTAVLLHEAIGDQLTCIYVNTGLMRAGESAQVVELFRDHYSVTIKSHHNVGGLPEKMDLKLVEPMRELFKDEVRDLGRALGMPEDFIRRHPFPGPGLAIRVPGEITAEKLEILRKADVVYLDEIKNAGLYDDIWQAFAVLLPVKTVGVMGDARTYDYVCALRAVTSTDGMTADYYPFSHEFLGRASTRIINEVKGINRVVYDITSKPPGTIEWE